MYRGIDDVLSDFAEERPKTARVLQAVAALGTGAEAAAIRPLAERVAWHLITAHRSVLAPLGLCTRAPDKGAPAPPAAEFAEIYQQVGAELLADLKAFSDEDLLREDLIYGLPWRRGHTLSIFLRHEIHHRGQLCTHLRLGGGRVPSIYGPSADER